MALYDETDLTDLPDSKYNFGIKLLQTQLQLKKSSSILVPSKKSNVLPPVIDLKSKKEIDPDDVYRTSVEKKFQPTAIKRETILNNEYDWNVIDEYDPMWPNDYEKLLKDKREKITQNRERDDRKRDDRKRTRGKDFQYVGIGRLSPPAKSGFSRERTNNSDDDESFNKSAASRSGAAIAPPPSLQEEVVTINPEILKAGSGVSIPFGSSSVAAKIMAKYGFKDGQGLGKQEQGMSMALQVEKTSKRGGRIIHEKEAMPPPPPVASMSTTLLPAEPKPEPSITEIMKAPSKVVLLRNMVGLGDVDSDLEPEVKDECNTKYGEVIRVLICEMPNVVPEEAVRIFVEFKRIESAIKAVVDLNGRFFGGRQVRAGFYNIEKFQVNNLMESI